MSYQFASRVERVRSSTVMELLRLAGQPGLISFAGGLPAPELFPVAELRAATDRVLDSQAASALQYGATEGYMPLRELVVREMATGGSSAESRTRSSRAALSRRSTSSPRVFLDEGDFVLTENPTYLAAIQVFQSYGARFAPVPTDDDGLIPSALPDLDRPPPTEAPLHRRQLPEPDRPNAHARAAARACRGRRAPRAACRGGRSLRKAPLPWDRHPADQLARLVRPRDLPEHVLEDGRARPPNGLRDRARGRPAAADRRQAGDGPPLLEPRPADSLRVSPGERHRAARRSGSAPPMASGTP